MFRLTQQRRPAARSQPVHSCNRSYVLQNPVLLIGSRYSIALLNNAFDAALVNLMFLVFHIWMFTEDLDMITFESLIHTKYESFDLRIGVSLLSEEERCPTRQFWIEVGVTNPVTCSLENLQCFLFRVFEYPKLCTFFMSVETKSRNAVAWLSPAVPIILKIIGESR